ncbi:hypothetical protein PG985_003560 [Apiospora marii]|uniref:Uncharacterized protein n=1 Tax=Apiospora marii TaxID=335849 RepID=A0ABR1SHW1_9PEZI
MLPRHQEPVRRRERLAQDEGQVANPGLVTAVADTAEVNQVPPVQEQHLALVPGDVQQGLHGVEGVLPRVEPAIDLAELAQEDADFVRLGEPAPFFFAVRVAELVDVVGRHAVGVLLGQQVDHLPEEGVQHLEHFALRGFAADESVELVGDALELAGVSLLGFAAAGEVAAVEGRQLGAVRQLGFHDLRGEGGDVAVLGRGQVQHSRVVPHEVVDLGAGFGRDAQVLEACVPVGADATFCDTRPCGNVLVLGDCLLKFRFSGV